MVLDTQAQIFLLIPTALPRDKYYHHSYFTDEETGSVRLNSCSSGKAGTGSRLVLLLNRPFPLPRRPWRAAEWQAGRQVKSALY